MLVFRVPPPKPRHAFYPILKISFKESNITIRNFVVFQMFGGHGYGEGGGFRYFLFYLFLKEWEARMADQFSLLEHQNQFASTTNDELEILPFKTNSSLNKALSCQEVNRKLRKLRFLTDTSQLAARFQWEF